MGGVRFAGAYEDPGPPGRIVLPGHRQLLVLRANQKKGECWDLVKQDGETVAKAQKVLGRRRFLLRALRADGLWEEFVVDGEVRGRRVNVYSRGAPAGSGDGDDLTGTICWGRFCRGARKGDGGVVRIEHHVDRELLLYMVWLAMLQWRKRPLGGSSGGHGDCVSTSRPGKSEAELGFS